MEGRCKGMFASVGVKAPGQLAATTRCGKLKSAIVPLPSCYLIPVLSLVLKRQRAMVALWDHPRISYVWEFTMPRPAVRPLKIGILMPLCEQAHAGRTARWSEFKAMALHAEAAGFDSLWVNDHLLFRVEGPEGPTRGIWEGWSLLSALAAVTSRVELGTFVICTSFRNPALTAKMADTVDEISDGRLILGLGAGWHAPEYQAFGFPYENVVSRFEEALQIIHPLLRTGCVDFHGSYYTAAECELSPRGPRRSGPPIMIGARADRPRALRLTAEYADYSNMFLKSDNLPPARAALDAACVKAGRDPATLKRTVSVNIEFPGVDTPSGEWFRNMAIGLTPPVTGTPEQLAEFFRGLARDGVDHVQIMLEPNSMKAIDAFRPVLELLDRG